MDRVRERVGDKRVLALVKAFLKAGILAEDGALRETDAGTPQGSILSPLRHSAKPHHCALYPHLADPDQLATLHIRKCETR
jgi:retron-type reverse transcriptase